MEFFILTLVNLGLILLVFLYFRSRFQQALNAPALLKDVKEEVDVLVKELNISAERNIAVLEERLAELEELLAQADSKMLMLAREVDRKEKSQETYSKIRRPVVSDAVNDASEKEKTLQPEKSPHESEGELFIGKPIEIPADLPRGPNPIFKAEKQKSMKERVLELRDQELDSLEISHRTGATLAEVELILSLNPRSFRP